MKSSPFVIPQKSEIIRYETKLSPNSKLVPRLLLKALPGVFTFARRDSYSCLIYVRYNFSAPTLVSSKRKPLHPPWDRGSHSRGAAGELQQLMTTQGFFRPWWRNNERGRDVLWKVQLPGLPLAKLTQSREEPRGCWASGDGWGTARTSPRARMALCASWSTFLWSTAKLQVESRTIAEILADLQTQRQKIPPGHCTVGYTAGNKAQVPATGPNSFLTASGTKQCILLQIPGWKLPSPTYLPTSSEQNRERLC